ncbi:hypothetical protein P4S91_10545 [Aneurinibacillus aneurinilyticus]|uniref:hypothetical protein n=1 Tax=Aneurinibacillus aneurinilyticus TaxID=1391 RepID=UPI002E2364EE|nr:hypothetical protein [Aneurinibacillus aneurinilyticus]MED0723354.1 hypothetical protein [Aneurinibacillus aneurinilyticus]MED0744088.1 hypothetical protein [Aneurinibacillus aneurinilyticus]
MEKFIRLDMKGHWRGKEHCSSFQGIAGDCWCEGECTCGGGWEDGISCYSLKYTADAVENLRAYWMGIARNTRVSDYENMQVTIFEGERVGVGSDYEDLATCERTILEVDAVPFMKKVLDAYEAFKYPYDTEEITEDEYNSILEKLVSELMVVSELMGDGDHE